LVNDLLLPARLQAALGDAYVLERELGGGGMSRLFVATERSLNRQVVIKVLPPELASEVSAARFKKEIEVAAQLQHPHIVPVLSAGEHGELLWYTMPFVEGVSLRDSLVHRGKFSPRTVTRVLHDVLDALAYAHRRGVIHRDIKPGNILHHGSHSLVTDFGVAKALSASLPHSGTTSVGIAIGTPAYMAPEQLAGEPVTAAADQFGLAVTLVELCSGARPFAGETPWALIDAIRAGAVLGEVPADVADIARRALAFDPVARFASVEDLRCALDGEIAGPRDLGAWVLTCVTT
jgi:serine/threonine-protein kinase